jgi:hypothetical protein
MTTLTSTLTTDYVCIPMDPYKLANITSPGVTSDSISTVSAKRVGRLVACTQLKQKKNYNVP